MAAETERQPSRLPLITEQNVLHRSKTQICRFCSAHELLATPTGDESVVAYRQNGLVAFTIKHKTNPEAEVTCLRWKPDGTSIAISWSDGTYAVYAGENGRLLNQRSARANEFGAERPWKLDLSPEFLDEDEADDGPVVSSFGWCSHVSGARLSAKKSPSEIGWMINTKDWFDAVGDEIETTKMERESLRDFIANLPRTITLLDATEVLPRLSALPSHGMSLAKSGAEGSKFLSQIAADSVFHPIQESGIDHVDILLASGSDESIHVLMDESVSIGKVDVVGKSILEASNPQSASHCLLREHNGMVKVGFLDLPIEKFGSPLLQVITTNTKRVQNLGMYIMHAVRCIQHDYTTGIAFPTRLIKNLVAELDEKEEGDLVSILSDLVMTGDFKATLLEWLVDIIKEPNHKRWHTAIETMYLHVQNHILTHLLLALDRLTIALTTLRGHSISREGSNAFDVSAHLFSNLLSTIDAMRIVLNRMQLVIATEMRQFRAFSKWLRVMIEVGGAGPFSRSAIEIEEREFPNIDSTLVLEYIGSTLSKSQLEQYVVLPQSLKGTCSKEEWLANPVLNRLGYTAAAEASRERRRADNTEQNGVAEPEAALNLSALAVKLSGQVRACLEGIAMWQGSMLKPPALVDVSIRSDEIRILDLRMVVTQDPPSNLALFPAVDIGNTGVLTLYSVDHATKAVRATAGFSLGQRILDAKFLQDNFLIVLIQTESEGHALVGLSSRAPSGYNPVLPPIWKQETLHNFEVKGSRTNPSHILVGNQSLKEVCVVLSEDGRDWQILDISKSAREAFVNANRSGEYSPNEAMDMS